MRPSSSSLLALACAGVFALAGCSGGSASVDDAGPSASPSEAPSSPSASPSPTAAPECPTTPTGNAARQVDPPAGDPATGTVSATLDTGVGPIAIDFDTDLAPCTVANFVSLAQQGFYDETRCHRLTTAGIFVLQCGDPSATGSGGPGYQFPDEVDGLSKELQCAGGSCIYPAGTVAMANAGPDTNGSQFFLVYDDSPLPPAYTVFGQMSKKGLAAVRGVAKDGTASGTPDGPPKDEVVITKVTGLS